MKGCRPLTDEEFPRVLNAIDGKYKLRNQLIVLLGIKAGFRISEILSLRIKDIYQHGVIPNHVTVQRRNVKGKKESRTLILHQSVKDGIQSYILERPSIDVEAPLFRSQAGYKAISRQQAWNVLEAAFAACGLTGTLGTHTLRKTFASNIYKKSGHCLLKTKRALGHTDVRTTERYLSFAESEVEDLITAT